MLERGACDGVGIDAAISGAERTWHEVAKSGVTTNILQRTKLEELELHPGPLGPRGGPKKTSCDVPRRHDARKCRDVENQGRIAIS